MYNYIEKNNSVLLLEIYIQILMQKLTMTKTKMNFTLSMQAEKDAGLNFFDIMVYIPFKNLVVSKK